MLFKQTKDMPHVRWIIEGRKTQSRRVWKRPHAKVGSLLPVQWAFCQPTRECPGWVKVTRVQDEAFWGVSPEDAKAEGYSTPEEYMAVFRKINPKFEMGRFVTVVDFEFIPNLDMDFPTFFMNWIEGRPA